MWDGPVCAANSSSGISPLRVLIAHNYYRQPGGEDQVFRAERTLLEDHGHEVLTHEVHNRDLRGLQLVTAGLQTVWSFSAARAVRDKTGSFRPDLVHFHNTFPQLSPSAYWVARRSGAAVVQTLHNFRLLCPSATLFREGRVCTECVNKTFAWPGVVHACYRSSALQSAVVASMLATHKLIGTYARAVDAYIPLTEFSRDLVVKAGLPAERVWVKPNFLADPGPPVNAARDSFLFVGRLSEEKGLQVLLASWRLLPAGVPLSIVGSGPLDQVARQASERQPNITWHGHLSAELVGRHLGEARALVMPSLWFEGFPIVLLEAFARGTPVIASNHGGLAELVADGRTGWLFEPGNVEDLAVKIEEARSDPDEAARRGREARREYERKYTPERNYQVLMRIYEAALEQRRRS
jgi:glycosyltransferase involved in cell wall biosynthesis